MASCLSAREDNIHIPARPRNILYLLCYLLTRLFDLCAFAPKVRCASKFSRHIFFLFCSQNCLKSFLVFCEKHSAAETCILRPTGLSVKEITRKNGKLRMLGGKIVIEKMEVLKTRNKAGRPQVLNKTAKIVLEKARYKRGNPTR